MQYKDWLYFLNDAMGRPFRKEAGLVVAKNDRRPLKYTPDGWQDISIGWERDLTAWGMLRNFTLPLGFVLDGADILRKLWAENNFEQAVYLLIQKQKLYIDPAQYYYYYDFFYKGLLDFTTYDDQETKVVINVAEGGLQQDLKANVGTDYQTPVDEIWVKMDGILLEQSAQFQNSDLDFSGSSALQDHYLPVTQLNVVGSNVNLATATQAFGAVSLSDQWFCEATGDDITVHLKSAITFHTNDRVISTRLQLVKLDVNNIPTTLFFQDNNPSPTTDTTWNLDVNIPLVKGDRLDFRAVIIPAGGPPNANQMHMTYKKTAISLGFNTRYHNTFVRALFPLTLLNRLAQQVSPGCVVQSSLLQTWANLAVSSFDAVRGLSGAAIKSNLTDFFTSFNAILNTAYGNIGSTLMYEGKDFFLNEGTVVPLGNVKVTSRKTWQEILANTVSIGYPSQQTNSVTDINGKQEYNTTAKFSSMVKKVTKELQLISVYRADCFGIEEARINLDGKTNVSDNADNDVCILNIDLANPQVDAVLGTYYNLKRGTYDTIEGLIHPESVFNLEDLTPARCMARHASYLNSIFCGFEGQALTFQTLDKNEDLATVQGSKVIREAADFIIQPTPRLFKPVLLDIIPETPINLVETLDANINSCFSYVDARNGQLYRGFSYKIGMAPNTQQEQAYLLIATPTVDFKTLET